MTGVPQRVNSPRVTQSLSCLPQIQHSWSQSLAVEDIPRYRNNVNSFPELILILRLTTCGHPPHGYDLASLHLVNS